MQKLEWYLADLKSTGKNTIETVEKSLTDMFIRLVRIYPCIMVSPPQVPVPLKHMYNANILRAEFAIFVPNYPPMWYTIIIPELSFFKNRFENGMLSSTVLSYSPLKVKWSNLPRSPQIFLRLFTENTHILLTPCNHPKISRHSYTSCHTRTRQCVLANYTQNYNSPVFFLIHQKQKQPYKAVICVRTL